MRVSIGITEPLAITEPLYLSFVNSIRQRQGDGVGERDEVRVRQQDGRTVGNALCHGLELAVDSEHAIRLAEHVRQRLLLGVADSVCVRLGAPICISPRLALPVYVGLALRLVVVASFNDCEDVDSADARHADLHANGHRFPGSLSVPVSNLGQLTLRERVVVDHSVDLLDSVGLHEL